MNLFTQSLDTALTPAVGKGGVTPETLAQWQAKMPGAWEKLAQQHSAELRAVMELPTRSDDLAQIEATADEIAGRYQALVVIGMGGSSLGAEVLATLATAPRLALHVLDTIDLYGFETVVNRLPWGKTAFLFVSKSGNTIELHALMGALMEAARARQCDLMKHSYFLTAQNDNPLRALAQRHGAPILAHDPALGGRFSILSAVGLIPAAALGLDIRAVRHGAAQVVAAHTGGRCPAMQAAALNMALMQ